MNQKYTEIMESLSDYFFDGLEKDALPEGMEVSEVIGKRDMRLFIDFPLKLYRDDPNFVFEPYRLQREFLSNKNPFFTHSSAKFYLARLQGVVVGRIASITNNVHNEVYNDSIGFFGFFECVKNIEIARALFNRVIADHRQSRFKRVIGPTNFTTNDSAGILVKGFNSPPVVMMPYNKPYYDEYLTTYGFGKETDLSSWFIDDSILGSMRYMEMAERLASRLAFSGITFRHVDFSNYNRDLKAACSIYNASNKDNWGFIPLTEQEFIHTGKQFRQFVPNDLMILAVKEEEIVGFVVALPDLNQAFKHIPSGRMLPTGFIKYLLYKRRINSARILILGVKESLRHSGIDVILYKKMQENLANHGIYSAEACYVMENNKVMQSILERLGAKKIKEYRIYSKEI